MKEKMEERNKGDEKNQMANVSLVNVEKTYSLLIKSHCLPNLPKTALNL